MHNEMITTIKQTSLPIILYRFFFLFPFLSLSEVTLDNDGNANKALHL